MITPGMCSLTLKHLPPEEIIRFVSKTRLQAIEWWGKDHMPPGNLALAKTLGRQTREAGLRISSYGSYYKAGISEPGEPSFETVLDTAAALGAPTIRVWAGNKNREDADETDIACAVEDTERIANLAAGADCSLTFEFHSGTLTNSARNAQFFAGRVPHPNVFFSWQPPHGFPPEQNALGLRGLLDRLSTVHVFHWTLGSFEKNLFNESQRTPVWPDDFHRHALEDGTEPWQTYLGLVGQSGRDHCALLEFVRGNSLRQARADAETLVRLCSPETSRKAGAIALSAPRI